jgi:hypothetical protein
MGGRFGRPIRCGRHGPAAVAEFGRWAPMKTLLVCCTLATLLTGCLLINLTGESWANRSVSVQLAAPSREDSIVIPVNGAEVQGALALVDEVLVSHGFTKFQPSPPAEYQRSFVAEEQTRGVLAYYYDGHCRVSFKDNTLHIGFVECGRTHSSAAVKAVCDVLRSELTKRYGADHVKGP